MKQNNNAERLLSLLEHDLKRDELKTLCLDRLEHLDMMMCAWRDMVVLSIQCAKDRAARGREE